MKSTIKRVTPEQEIIYAELTDIRNRLEIAQNKLDNTTDNILIDSIIFEIKSLHKKHEYYLNLCKEMGMAVSTFTKIS